MTSDWHCAEILGVAVAAVLANIFWGDSTAVRTLLVAVMGVAAGCLFGLPWCMLVHRRKCVEEEEEEEPETEHADQVVHSEQHGQKVCPCGEHDLEDENCPHHKDFWREFERPVEEEHGQEEQAENILEILAGLGEEVPEDVLLQATVEEDEEEEEEEEDSEEDVALGDAFQIMRDMEADDFDIVTVQNKGGNHEEASAEANKEEEAEDDGEHIQVKLYPWHRSPHVLPEPSDVGALEKPARKPMSVLAREFVPPASYKADIGKLDSKPFSVEAPEFVPRWARKEVDTDSSDPAAKLPPWKRAAWKSSAKDADFEEVCSETQPHSPATQQACVLDSPASCSSTASDVGTSKMDSDATTSEDSAGEDSSDEIFVTTQEIASSDICDSAHAEPKGVLFDISDLLKWRAAVGSDEVNTFEEPGRLTVYTEPQTESLTPKESPLSPTSASWRQEVGESQDWRSEAPIVAEKKKLQVSENSWAAKQRARRSQQADSSVAKTDEDVVRTMKLILNKLTIEKFPQLYQQMIACGIQTSSHLEHLIREVFEKATMQHHFIDMYADLCAQLHEHFAKNPIIDDPSASFKRILLNACQSSFERYLSPSEDLSSLGAEEKAEAAIKHKMRMLGNIRFVGALLVRKMLASKVMLAIVAELLNESTPEALETLAALLTVVGAEFDTPTFMHRVAFNAIFCQVRDLIKKTSTPPRVRFLLKDVLDLRASGWSDKKPQKIEKPTTLEEVHHKASLED